MFKGILLSISASCLFGLVYYFPVLLRPLSVVEIFCWRLLMSCPAIAILITFEKRWDAVLSLLKKIKRNPLFILAILFSSSMLAIQMLIFIWAPLTGKALSTSLGYFILPLMMVISGRFVYKEKFSVYQRVAITLAVLGVIYELWTTGAFSWETVVVALGYPIYLIFRRELGLDGIEGTFSDFFCIAVACAIYLCTQYSAAEIKMQFVYHPVAIPMLGVITAIAFAAYFVAAKLLPLGLFGLLSYIEPALLAIVSIVLLHETISPDHIWTYVLVWSAVCLLMVEGLVYTIRSISRRKYIREIKDNL
ncbi:EamA family transporter RarD [Utexia brackfieldae]|uniref:EamA family transporter RarD n=1 Tax=Utexia brackfieldae TaxID=3074108 RepID=UPI00370DDF21